MRELDAHNRGAYTIQELRRMYDSIIKDIDKEIKKIFNTYKNGVQITAEEAEQLINKAAQNQIADRLSEILKDTEDPKQRLELMRKIHAQAYGARISRLEAVKLNVYAYFKEKALTEIEKTKTLYNTVIEESYYRTVHDIAKGCNVGVYFSLIPKRAVNEMLESKWHGEQFSDRVWNNTAKVAEQSQKIITEGLMSHAGYTQMAARLAEIMETSKYNAQRLVNTQVSYFMNMAELRAYEELGIEQYKYLATLDERTCESCSPLDNKIFKVSEAVGGVNYPPMHPHCRCTTTMPTDYARRWARDPLTGKGYKIKGMSYNEWIESLTDKQKEAFDKHVVMYRNRGGDKKQYVRYTEVLGKKNVPKTFDEFQNIKYNYTNQWDDLKYYARNINGRPIEYVKIDRELEKAGIKNKGKAYPVEDIKINGWRVHAENRIKQSGISKAEALTYKKNAIAIMKRYPEPNTLCDYYSSSGVIGVKSYSGIVQTVISKDRMMNDTLVVIEVMKKWLK